MKKKKTQLRKSDILYHILKGWRIILLFTILGLIGGISIIGFGYIRGEMSKEYRVTSSIAIVAQNENGQFTSLSANPFKTDVDIARSLTEDAMYIIKSSDCLQKVVDRTGLRGISAGNIASNLTLNRFGDTEIIEMTLLWRSEKEGIEIMKAITDISDTALLDALKIGRISVINEPKASFIVGGNISITTWIYSALAGFVLGVVFSLLRFILGATVINGTDLEEDLGLDLLAILPFDSDFSKMKPLDNNNIPIRDDINSLAHMLVNRMGLNHISRIYITSAEHSEGRTRLIATIAYYLSELGKRTLLVDFDLKNPQIGALFRDNLEYEQTLNALYRGDSDKIDAVLNVKGCLDVLPVILQKVPENFNDDMLRAVSEVMEGYDYVLIDAGPVGEDAEVLRMNEISDAALFVIRCDYATVDNIKKSLRRLDKSGIPVIGGVFNASNSWKDAFKKTKKRIDKVEDIVSEKLEKAEQPDEYDSDEAENKKDKKNKKEKKEKKKKEKSKGSAKADEESTKAEEQQDADASEKSEKKAEAPAEKSSSSEKKNKKGKKNK